MLGMPFCFIFPVLVIKKNNAATLIIKLIVKFSINFKELASFIILLKILIIVILQALMWFMITLSV